MHSILRCLRGLWRDRRGGTAIEYGMILALIVIGLIAAVSSLGAVTSDLWNGVAQNVIQNGPQR